MIVRRPSVALFLFLALALTACAGADPQQDGSEGGSSQEQASDGGGTSSAESDDAGGTASAETDDATGTTGDAVDSEPGDSGAAPDLSAAEQSFVDDSEAADDVFPGAVLEAGHEACLRMQNTAAADPEALVSALVTGQIPDAANAIRNLCPELADYLQQALSGFGDGTFDVADEAVPGETVSPGSYTAIGPSAACYFVVTDSEGAQLAQGAVNQGDDAVMAVPPEASQVESSGCFAWVSTQ